MDNEKKSTPREKKPRQGPRPATPERLEKAALHYLERYATSAENLRRVLMRRVHRSAQLHDTDPEVGAETVDDLIARYRRARLLDDVGYATGRAGSLHRQGKSARYIRGSLAAKGVAADDIDQALDALSEEIGQVDGDLVAAVNYARRRRIGPWRRADRETYRDRDLAALGRQGFGYDIARKVVEAKDPERLEEEATP